MYKAIKKIVIFTSNTCNMGCDYCFEGDKMKSMEPFTDFKTLHKFVKKLPLAHDIVFKFQGGEPLLNPDAIEACFDEMSELDTYGYNTYYGMNTNGCPVGTLNDLMHKGYIQPDYVNISFDGIMADTKMDIYELNKVDHKDLITVRIAAVPKLINHLAETFLLVSSMGFNVQYYLLDDVDYSGYEEDFRYQLRWLIKTQSMHHNNIASKVYFRGCPNLGNTIFIDGKGNIYMCGMCSSIALGSEEYAIGNIYDGFDRDKYTQMLNNICKNNKTKCFAREFIIGSDHEKGKTELISIEKEECKTSTLNVKYNPIVPPDFPFSDLSTSKSN